MKIDWKLKGWNLLKFGCNANAIIHPETCIDVVKVSHNDEQSLYDWITTDCSGDMNTSLKAWFLANVIDIGTGTISVSDIWDENSALGTLTDSNSSILGNLRSAPNNKVRVPFATKNTVAEPLYGVVQAGNGLNVSDGVLSIGEATSTYYGGVKIGSVLTSNPLIIPVELTNTGIAYVEIPDSAKLYHWDWAHYSDSQTYSSIKAYYPENTLRLYGKNLKEDTNISTALTNYFLSISTIGGEEPNWNRIFPVMADITGALYTYVPYPTYNQMAASGAANRQLGLVPITPATAGTTKFLREDASWAEIPQFSSSVNGLVPAASGTGATSKFLKGNGTWAAPYNVATHDNAEGLLQLKSDDVEANIAEPADETTMIAPVVYSYKESNEGHGVSIDTIVKAIEDSDGTFLIPLTQAIIGALSTGTEEAAEILKTLVDAICNDEYCINALKNEINP